MRLPFTVIGGFHGAGTATLLRLEGWCHLAGRAEPMLLQMVGSRWELTPAPELGPGIALVGIGRPRLPAEDVTAMLDSALV
jgi:hypothetical protein